jgi:uncharacterized protein YycO
MYTLKGIDMTTQLEILAKNYALVLVQYHIITKNSEAFDDAERKRVYRELCDAQNELNYAASQEVDELLA